MAELLARDATCVTDPPLDVAAAASSSLHVVAGAGEDHQATAVSSPPTGVPNSQRNWVVAADRVSYNRTRIDRAGLQAKAIIFPNFGSI